jgi:hypothetical protein
MSGLYKAISSSRWIRTSIRILHMCAHPPQQCMYAAVQLPRWALIRYYREAFPRILSLPRIPLHHRPPVFPQRDAHFRMCGRVLLKTV